MTTLRQDRGVHSQFERDTPLPVPQEAHGPKSQPNLHSVERAASGIGGAAAVLIGLDLVSGLGRPADAGAGEKIGGALLTAAGLALAVRGFTGRSKFYEAIGYDSSSGEIDVRESVLIDRPRDEVYARWHRWEDLPGIMKHLQSVEDLGDGLTKWTAKGPADTTYTWVARTRRNDGKRIAWTTVDDHPDTQIANHGVVTFEDAPGNRGTMLRVQLAYTPPYAGATAAVAKLFGREPAQEVYRDLKQFKQHMETGEVATIEGQPRGNCA
jgi:uncharacterized membrane protein